MMELKKLFDVRFKRRTKLNVLTKFKKSCYQKEQREPVPYYLFQKPVPVDLRIMRYVFKFMIMIANATSKIRPS